MVKMLTKEQRKFKNVRLYLLDRAAELYREVEELTREAAKYPIGAQVELTVDAGGRTFTLRVRTTKASIHSEVVQTPDPESANTLDENNVATQLAYYMTSNEQYEHVNPIYRSSPETLREIADYMDALEEALQLIRAEYERQLESVWEKQSALVEKVEVWMAEQALRQ